MAQRESVGGMRPLPPERYVRDDHRSSLAALIGPLDAEKRAKSNRKRLCRPPARGTEGVGGVAGRVGKAPPIQSGRHIASRATGASNHPNFGASNARAVALPSPHTWNGPGAARRAAARPCTHGTDIRDTNRGSLESHAARLSPPPKQNKFGHTPPVYSRGTTPGLRVAAPESHESGRALARRASRRRGSVRSVGGWSSGSHGFGWQRELKKSWSTETWRLAVWDRDWAVTSVLPQMPRRCAAAQNV
jgi:hypothetical protein